MPGDMRKIMQAAQQMQAEMQKAQEELEAETFTASSGGGMVTATVTGGLEVVSIEFESSALDPDDPELTADLVVAAVNAALNQARDAAAQAMGGAAGLDLGGLGGDLPSLLGG